MKLEDALQYQNEKDWSILRDRIES